MTAIRLERIGKRYGTVAVLDGLDLQVRAGEFFTFLGPSGCGKSTLLNMIAGIETPDAGDIWFDEQRVTDMAPAQRDVAMVFQSYALYPHMSVRANIAFPLENRKVPSGEIDAAVERMATRLGIKDLLARRPRELSGGQRQRVALGRALVRTPRVFLLDEPLSNLDARLRLEMREELKRLHAELGITTVYVTHDQEEAMVLSHRIALLHEGRLQQCGTPHEIYTDPANLFVAQFIGSPPMTIISGDAVRDVPGVAPLLAGRANQSLLLGVRPADVEVHPVLRPGGIEARVELIEPTGSDLWVVGRWAGQRIKGRAVPGARLEPGATAHFGLPPGRIYYFNADSGARLRPG